MQRATFSLLIFIKKSKLLKNGKAPIYLRLTINNQASEVSLKRSIEEERWDVKRELAKGNSPESKLINDYLNSVRGQIYNYHREFQEAGKIITAKGIINSFLGIHEIQHTLLKLFEEHNNDLKLLVDKQFAKATYNKYECIKKHCQEFIQLTYQREDVYITEVDHQFILGFEKYLKTTCQIGQNTTMKYLVGLKKITKQAIANDILKKDPFLKFKFKKIPVHRGFLTMHEINLIRNKEISIERLDIIRDVFLFQCFTGLAYIDIKQLTMDNIQIGIDGNKWIFTKREKTDNPCRIPLLPIPLELIEKYKNHIYRRKDKRILPVPSNQKMNAYLKEIADICEINKNLHSHLARHTFATTIALSNGIPMESVSKLLGHSNINITQVYAKVLDQKISEEVQKASLRIFG